LEASEDDPPCPPPFYPAPNIFAALQQLYAAAFDPCTERAAEEKATVAAFGGMFIGAIIGATADD